jgi:hypothetical protein
MQDKSRLMQWIGRNHFKIKFQSIQTVDRLTNQGRLSSPSDLSAGSFYSWKRQTKWQAKFRVFTLKGHGLVGYDAVCFVWWNCTDVSKGPVGPKMETKSGRLQKVFCLFNKSTRRHNPKDCNLYSPSSALTVIRSSNLKNSFFTVYQSLRLLNTEWRDV